MTRGAIIPDTITPKELAEDGSTAFWLDGMIACGQAIVATRKDGDPQYSLTEEGLRDGTKLIRGARRP